MFSWLPVITSPSRLTRTLNSRVADPADPLSATPAKHSLRLVIWLPGILRAATAGPEDWQGWALGALEASRALLDRYDPVAALLVARRASQGPSCDRREAALLAEHLAALAANESFLRHWSRDLRAALASVAPPRQQRPATEPCVVVRPDLVRKAPNRSGIKAPAFVREPRPQLDALGLEARWMLACNSARDGARRDGGSVLVHLPAYLFVARLLDRPLWGPADFTLPDLAAPREEWFAAAKVWGNFFIKNTDRQWINRYAPHGRAAALGWAVAEDVPMLLLKAAPLELTAGGRGKRLPAVAQAVQSGRGNTKYIPFPYNAGTVMVARRNSRFTPVKHLYYEVFFEMPAQLKQLRYHRIRLKGRTLWSLHAISKAAELGVPEAIEYLPFVRDVDMALYAEGFERELELQKYQRLVEARIAEPTARMGKFNQIEVENLAHLLETREPGPIYDDFWESAAAALPGRTPVIVRRLAVRLMKQHVAKVGWEAFRQSGYWPGGDLSRSLYAWAKHNRMRRPPTV